MTTTYAPFDASAYLDNDQIIAEYLDAAGEYPNTVVFLAALGNVAKARGMAQIAKDAGAGAGKRCIALNIGVHLRFKTARSHNLQVAGPKRNSFGLPKKGLKMIERIVVAIPILITLIFPAKAGSIRYKEIGGRTKELSGLFTDKNCFPARMHGKVVKRDFSPDGITLKSFVLENKDGTRDLINVEISNDLSMVDLGYVTQGLQTLILEGKQIKGQLRQCGAAGRFLMLESVR